MFAQNCVPSHQEHVEIFHFENSDLLEPLENGSKALITAHAAYMVMYEAKDNVKHE